MNERASMSGESTAASSTDVTPLARGGVRHSSLYAVDFFCGAGGMTQGLRAAGIAVVAGVDVDGGMRATYEANHAPASRFVQRDIRECSAEDVKGWIPAGGRPEELVLVGCSPCQFWSRVPSSKVASKDGSTLLLELGRLARELRPGYVVVENVPGLMKLGTHAVLSPFLADLKAAGFRNWAFEEVRSAWYGVPQRRPRFLLVASRYHDVVTLPPHDPQAAPTVREFIGVHNGFMHLRAGETDPDDPWHRASALSPDNELRIEMTPPDGGDRRAWRDTELQLATYRSRNGSFRNVYGRLWWDQPAATLTTRFNSLSNGRFGHPTEHRALSVREGATLQTFPRDYVFEGGLHAVCRQIGNAVPPMVAEAIGRHLVDAHASGKFASQPNDVHP